MGGRWDARTGEETKVKLMEMKMAEIVEQFEEALAMKDDELARGMEAISEMQERLAGAQEELEEIEKLWEARIQKKEEGYAALCGDLRFCEGQLELERQRVEDERRNVKRLEAHIAQLEAEFEEELKCRNE